MKRRHIIAMAALGCAGAPSIALARQAATILILGDSLSAEYGLARGSGWVALLEKRLQESAMAARVINASISGDTTSGGHSRLSALLQQHHPSHLVIELGGNDALRGLPLALTQLNLTQMSQQALRSGAKVMLIGMQMPPNYGKDYNARYAAMYRQVARTNQAGLVPFFLQGLADSPDGERWFQADRIHPNAQAQPLMLETVWPELIKLLK